MGSREEKLCMLLFFDWSRQGPRIGNVWPWDDNDRSCMCANADQKVLVAYVTKTESVSAPEGSETLYSNMLSEPYSRK